FGRHGAEHRHLRAVLSTAFTPRKVEQLRPAARAVAERLAEGIAASGGEPCEFVAAFAEPLPPEVFAILFGLPVEDRDQMARWAGTIARAFSVQMTAADVEAVEAVAAEMRAYGRERIAASRAAPGDDLVTRLVQAEVDGERLSDGRRGGGPGRLRCPRLAPRALPRPPARRRSGPRHLTGRRLSAAHRIAEVERPAALDDDGVLEHDVAADELAEVADAGAEQHRH